ncbi:SDR family NAD(P)-dependent oxidoreductase [Novosphingobium colocasiae]|uniref:SDR family NAD(P)-dependent oxidoreductase n=1 Tax=Novosphingobium colocasiae TaxID=1256513 RepID=UPI001E295C38|nr:glucose 1-dehydrogenase [Novosphingobium colocasiae]
MKDKVAIVSGAGSLRGIGFATAVALAKEGARVVLTDLDEDEVAARSREIGSNAIGFAQDVTNVNSWEELVATTIERFGTIDVLVNNAGIAIPNVSTGVSLSEWNRQIEVNLTAPFCGTQAVVRAMQNFGKGGAIINVSSIAGVVGVAGCAAYSASKGGLRLLTKAMALELAPMGITVNSVHPGLIATAMQDETMTPKQIERMARSVPLKRRGEPVDIAMTILFLATDEARYITGAEFIVDGGMTAQAGMLVD